MEVLFLICGLIVGVGLTIIATRIRRIGTLVVYIPDTDDAPYLTLELEQSVSQVASKKYVTAQVNVRKLHTHH